MPVADPIYGRLFIWVISCFLFLSIAIGGTFLVLYILLPQTESRSWLPVAGILLVCLPWIFWCLACLYRIFSRAFGFRVVLGGNGCGDGGGTGGRVSAHEHANNERPLEQPKQADEFGGDGNNLDNSAEKNPNLRTLSTNDLSVSSRESEMPLATSMAS